MTRKWFEKLKILHCDQIVKKNKKIYILKRITINTFHNTN